VIRRLAKVLLLPVIKAPDQGGTTDRSYDEGAGTSLR
jgi:hypothetical protein